MKISLYIQGMGFDNLGIVLHWRDMYRLDIKDSISLYKYKNLSIEYSRLNLNSYDNNLDIHRIEN